MIKIRAEICSTINLCVDKYTIVLYYNIVMIRRSRITTLILYSYKQRDDRLYIIKRQTPHIPVVGVSKPESND